MDRGKGRRSKQKEQWVQRQGAERGTGVPRTARIPQRLEPECTGGGVASGRLGSWSVVRPQRPLCGISLRDLGCARGPGESVGQ